MLHHMDDAADATGATLDGQPCIAATVQRPKTSLEMLPTEILLPILFHCSTPALIHVSRRLRSVLPPYVRHTKAMAAIATCPEGPESVMMSLVFDRVMDHYYADCWIVPLTSARKWEIRNAVWSSQWFGARQFEKIVLELYRGFLRETLRFVKPRFSHELQRLRVHMSTCQDLSMVVGEEFVAGVNFKGVKASRGKKARRGSKGDLLFTFNSITASLPSGEHRLDFWGIRHLYDLPDGIFNTPVTADQLRLIKFLTTLDWHWKSTSILTPMRNHAFGEAVSWAIRERAAFCLEALLGLYSKVRQAGNEQALHINRHMREGVETGDRQMLECLCRGFRIPFSMVDFFQDLATNSNNKERANE